MFPPSVLVALLVSAVLQPAPQDLARNLQRKYEQIQSFSADFEHVYEGGLLRKKVTERGTVVVRKPGMMHWTYTSPEKKEFVSDGKKLYSYIPDDRQVIVSPVPPADEASSPALFLAGKGSIARDFKASEASVPGLASDEYALKLVPAKLQEEYRLAGAGGRAREPRVAPAGDGRLPGGDLDLRLQPLSREREVA